MMWWLIRTTIALAVLYYSVKIGFVMALNPMLRPFGVRVGGVGIVSGLSEVEFEPASGDTGKDVQVVSVGLKNARIGVGLEMSAGRVKVTINVSGLAVRLRKMRMETDVAAWLSGDQNEAVSAQQQALNLKHAVDNATVSAVRIIKRLSLLMRASFVFRFVSMEVRLTGMDVKVEDMESVIVRVSDPEFSIIAKIDSPVASPDSKENAIVLSIQVSQMSATASANASSNSDSGSANMNIELIRFVDPSTLTVKLDMKTGQHSITLALPAIFIQSVHAVMQCLSKLKSQKKQSQTQVEMFDADAAFAEYSTNKEYYISLLRHSFLSAIHGFYPSIKMTMAQLIIQAPSVPIPGFDEFDLDVPTVIAKLDSFNFETHLSSSLGTASQYGGEPETLKSNTAEPSEDKTLWMECAAKAERVLVECQFNNSDGKPFRKHNIFSIPAIDLALAVSIPVLSATASKKGLIRFASHIESLQILLPSRVFILMNMLATMQKATRAKLPNDGRAFKNFQRWTNVLVENYAFEVNLAIHDVVLGIRLGSYKGYDDACDAFLAVSCEQIGLVSNLPKSANDANGFENDLQLIDLTLFMAPVVLVAYAEESGSAATLSPPHCCFNTLDLQNSLIYIAESRSFVTVSVTKRHLLVHVDGAFAHLTGNLANMASASADQQQPQLDFFAVSTFVAQLIQKVLLIKAAYPAAALAVPPVPVMFTFLLKSTRVSLIASENLTCAMSVNGADVLFQGEIAADMSQTFYASANRLTVESLSGALAKAGERQNQYSCTLTEQVAFSERMVLRFHKAMGPGKESVLPALGLEFPGLDLDLNLRRFFVCFTSYLPILKMTKIINARDGGPTGIDFEIEIKTLNLKADFASGTKLKVSLKELSAKLSGNQRGSGSITSVTLNTPDKSDTWHKVLFINAITLDFIKQPLPDAKNGDKIIISIIGKQADVTIPFAFEFSDLFEDMINFQKAVKQLIFERMGLVSMAKLTVGKTLFKESEMPEYRIQIDKVAFRILDDLFESKLARNYREGFEEQFGRLSREKAFQKRAVPMRDQDWDGLKSSIEDAFWAIQEYNSKSWIRRISRTAHVAYPALLSATITNLSAVVTPPTLPGSSIEESIHFIDPQTPVAIVYDDLIARDVLATVNDFVLQLRDYPVPLVQISGDKKGSLSIPTWATQGLLIIADIFAGSESKRVVNLGLEPVNVAAISVTRNLCPVKIYAESKTDINVSTTNPLFVAWGMCVEPPLADMIRVLDTFTKATVDPSPPVGWWDKMRHMVHLGKTVFNIGPGDFKLRILGSMTPYYDARFHYGTEGVDIAFGSGAKIEFCNEIPEENIVIECGKLTFSIPSSVHEEGRISGGHRAEVVDDIFAQLCGGVRLAVGIRFTTLDEDENEIDPWKNHSEVLLKLPEYAVGDNNVVLDSYHGFRSKLIHVVYDIQSPHSKFNSSEPSSNFLSFTNESYYRFCELIPVYQSPLAIIPIRRGPLFEKNIDPTLEKPKLGRSIKTNHLKGSMHPLILSFLCEFEDATGGVGLRLGAKRMDIDMVFEQKKVMIKKEGFSETSCVSKWLLQTAKVEFSEVEGRTISFASEKSGAENKYKSAGSDHVLDHKEWFLDIDYNFVSTHSAFDMVPFVWSPKVKYFKRDQESEFEMEHKLHSETEVHRDQIALYHARLHEIEAAIAHYVIVQKAFGDRKLITNDDTFLQASQALIDKLTVLFEKKQAIERHIRNSVRHVNDFSKQPSKSRDHLSKNDAIFDHHYVIHNINFLWKKEVRNICLRFFALIYRESALYYCLSNAALKTAKELLNASITENTKKKSRQTFDPESGMMRDFDSKASNDLLEMLLNDLDNLYVSCEGEEEIFSKAKQAPSDSKTASADMLTYVPSRDADSLDYVAPNMCVNSNYIIQLVNPQVNFESAPKAKPAALHSVVMVAETMQFRSISILESTAMDTLASLGNLDEIQRRNEDLVKTRTILDVQNAQFFTCSYEDAKNETENNPFIVNHGAAHEPEDKRKGKHHFWPVWVPVESVTWTDFEVEQSLQRVVGRTSASFYRDKPNPLYVRRTSSTTKNDFTDTYTVDFPDFKIEANSKQFFIVLDIVTNLLMYHDPTSGERSKKLRKMMLALDQMPNLAIVFDSVLILQERIRQGSKLLKFGRKMQDRNHPSHMKAHSYLTSSQTTDVRQSLLQYQEEMYVIMEALKALSILEQKKNSLEVALQLNIYAKNLVWTMIQDVKPFDDKVQPLAQWKLTGTRFLWIQNEDQSSVNTLEIDKVYLENLLPNGFFKNMIGPHGDIRGIDFSRNKMVRVYWKDMAPVAGIKVIEHFEVNLYPLLLQISRETGRAAEKYFFPKTKATADDDAEVGETVNEKRINVAAAVTSRRRKEKVVESSEPYDEFKEMQQRAAENRSFVYIKVPTLQLCLSYKGLKDKNIEDLNMFTFLLPTMEYRNKTWGWQDVFDALKKDAIKAVLHNSGNLVREKLFTKNSKMVENELHHEPDANARQESTEKEVPHEETRRGRLFGLIGSGSSGKKKDANH
ncbi:golgi-body localization protein domain-containing protein [Chytriomyces cf. hyalinus JEL632]|nr:golgi-body localization protein domain-containing protein [Chytriomyces cf. hyalinus JEL632]